MPLFMTKLAKIDTLQCIYDQNAWKILPFSGGSSGGARGSPHPLFWVKKDEMTEGRKAAQVK